MSDTTTNVILTQIAHMLGSIATSLVNIDDRLALLCEDEDPEEMPEVDLDGNPGASARDPSQSL